MTALATTPIPSVPAGSGATFRRWRGLDDIPGMAAANARLRVHVGLLEPIDVDAMRHRYTHLVNSDPDVDMILVERDGAVRGYARAEWHDLVEGSRVYDNLVVLEPSAWGLGIAEAMLAWCGARSLELAREHPTDRPAFLGSYGFGGDANLELALASHGYTAARWDAEMLRPTMDDLPPVELADGYELRAPEEAELRSVHAMMTRAFAEHWGEWEGADFVFEEWADDPRFRRELVVVAWRDGEPAAVVSNKLETLADGSTRGLLDSVCTDPGHRRRGLARAAIARSLEILRSEGATAAYLGVDTDNHNRALALYESCGFRVVSTSTAYRKPITGLEVSR
jgi:ribosomal protein S18 acetylase RimI-like enzyme